MNSDQSKVLRIIWDWYQHGGNKRKNDAGHNGQCKLCGALDNQEHWTSQCCNQGCAETKYLTGETVAKVIDELPVEGDYRAIAKFVCKLSEEPVTGYMIKLGFYGQADIKRIMEKFPKEYSKEESKLIKEMLVEMGYAWAEGILRLYDYKIRGGKIRRNNQYYESRLLVRESVKAIKAHKRDKQRAKPRKKMSKAAALQRYQALNGCLLRPIVAAGELRARVGVG